MKTTITRFLICIILCFGCVQIINAQCTSYNATYYYGGICSSSGSFTYAGVSSKTYWYTGNTQQEWFQSGPAVGGVCTGDSVIIYNGVNKENYDTVIRCETTGSYTWYDKTTPLHTFTSDETYSTNLQTTLFCDSSVHMTVYFRQPTECQDTFNLTKCDSYQWTFYDGPKAPANLIKLPTPSSPYTSSQPDVTYTLTHASKKCTITRETKSNNTCDSTYHLNLTINYGTNQEYSIYICSGNHYSWLVDSSFEGTGKTKNDAWGTPAYKNQTTNTPLFNLTTPGDYKAIVSNNVNCPDSVTLHLNVYSGDDTYLPAEKACKDFTWTVKNRDGSTAYTTNYTAGNHEVKRIGFGDTAVRTVLNGEGCDSSIYLYLLLVGYDTTFIDTAVCRSRGEYSFRGTEKTATGIYDFNVTGQTETWTNASPSFSISHTCDSVFQVDLKTYTDAAATTIDTTICKQPSFYWHVTGLTYVSNTSLTNQHVVKVYNDGTPAAEYVCDSIYNLNLTFATDKRKDTLIIEDCEAYTWVRPSHADRIVNGTMNKKDTIFDTIVGVAAFGCDSIFTLFLTTHDTVSIDEHATCDSILWHANKYYSNIHFDSTNRSEVLAQPVRYRGAQIAGTTNPACKQVDFLYLTLYPSYNNSEPKDTTPTGPFCGFYTWSPYTTPSTKISKTVTYEEAETNTGNYTTADRLSHAWTAESKAAYDAGKMANGCDSIRNLVLTAGGNIFTKKQNVLVDTSKVCDSVWLGQDYLGQVRMAYQVDDAPIVTGNNALVHYKSSTNKVIRVWDTLTGASNAGCDSIAHYVYKLYNNFDSIKTTYHCDSTLYNTLWIKRDTIFEQDATRIEDCIEGTCDSIFYRKFFIYPTYHQTVDIYACDSMQWGTVGYLYKKNGTKWTNNIWKDNISSLDSNVYNKEKTHTTGATCDSIVYLNLTLKTQTAADTIDRSAYYCYQYTWTKPDGSTQRFPAAGMASSDIDTIVYFTGVYNALTSERDPLDFQCDTTVRLHLQVYATSYGVDNVEACDSVSVSTSSGAMQWYYSNAVDIIPYARVISEHPLMQCDSMVTYNITVNHGSRATLDTAVCDSITFNDFRVGYPKYPRRDTIDTIRHYDDASGCKAHDTIRVVILPTGYSDTVSESGCDHYTWKGNDYMVSGIHEKITNGGGMITHTYQFADGHTRDFKCDTIDILNLTLHYKTHGDTVAVACDSFTWYNVVYDTNNYDTVNKITKGIGPNDSVRHQWPGANQYGCDSSTTLILTLHHTSREISTQVGVCDSFYWTGGAVDRWFYNDTLTTEFDTLPGADIHGCDSLVKLSLTMGYTTDFTFSDAEKCDSFFWEPKKWFLDQTTPGNPKNGWYYHIPGSDDSTDYVIYRRGGERQNHFGCDSIVRIKIILHERYPHVAVPVTGCDSILWNGKYFKHNYPYYEANNLVHTLKDTLPTVLHGCDSILVLHPTINKTTDDTTKQDTHRCAFYKWHLTWTTGSYDSTFTYEEGAIQYDTIAAKNSVGCDSIVTLTVHLYDTRRDSIGTKELYNKLYGEYNSYFCDSVTWIPSPRGKTHKLTTPGIYRDTILNAFTFGSVALCDSIYTLNVDFHYSTTKDTIFPAGCDSLKYKMVQYYDTTNLLEKHASNIAGCDSLWNITLVVKPSTHHVTYDTVCDYYTWSNSHGRWSSTPTWDTTFAHTHVDNTVTELFSKTHKYNNDKDCESVDTLYLVLKPSDTTTLDTFGCRTYSWRVSNASLGTYIDTSLTNSKDTALCKTINVFGCNHYDSISLKIYDDVDTIVDTIGCNSFTWMNNDVYIKDTHGVGTRYVPGIKTPYGCDTIYYLNLHFFETRNNDFSGSPIDHCGGYEWKINGKKKERNGGAYVVYSESGTYIDTAKSVESNFHCDSIVTISLNITGNNHVTKPDGGFYNDTVYIARCEGTLDTSWPYMRGGILKTTLLRGPKTCDDTVYEHIRWESADASDCDTVVYIHYVVKHKVYSAPHIVDTCHNYSWIGTTHEWHNTYGERDTAIWTFTKGAANGCDSIDSLIVNFGTITGTKLDTFACDSFTWTNRNKVIGTYSSIAHDSIFDTVQRIGNCPYIDTLVFDLKFTAARYDTIHVKACNTYNWQAYADSSITTYNARPTLNATKRIKHFTYAEGCDSTLWLDLDLHDDYIRVEDSSAVCDSLHWRDTVFYAYTKYHKIGDDTVKRIYHDVLYGCDTTYIINVELFPSKEIDTIVHACDSLIWKYTDTYGTHYLDTLRNGEDADGEYTRTLDWTTTPSGCDIRIKLHFASKPSKHYNTKPDDVCISYTWKPENLDASYYRTYTASIDTAFTHTHSYAEECDTTWTLKLTVGSYDVYTTDTMVCDSMLYKGKWYNADSVAQGIFPADTTPRDHGLCDSIHRYNLTIHFTSRDTSDRRVACAGEGYTDPKTLHYYYDDIDRILPQDTLKAQFTVNGCDSIPYIAFHVVTPGHKDSVVAKACDMFSFSFFDGSVTNNDTYTQASYPDILNPHLYTHPDGDINGCDSTLNLSFAQFDTSSMRRDSVAQGCNPFVWHGNSYTVNTIDTITLGTINQHGCDSLVRVSVEVYNANSGIDNIEVCDIRYKWKGTWYNTSISSSDPAAPSVTIPNGNIHGCDSTVTLDLVLNSPKYGDTVAIECDSFIWYGNKYTSSTSTPYPTHAIPLGPGKCDSTVSLILVMKHSTYNEETHSDCDSYIWPFNSKTYSSTQDVTDTMPGPNGCDSIVTLHLTINIGTDRYDTVHACDFYTWNGIPFSADTLSDDLPHKYGKHISSPNPLCQYEDSLVLFMFKNTGHRLPADTACISKLWIRRNTTAITLNETGIYYNSSFENTPYTHFGHNGTWNCAFTDTLDLTILNTSMRTNDVHACDNYQWTRTINGVEVINRTVTSVPAIGYVTQPYALTVGSYTCSGAETMRDTLDIVIGHNTALPTTRLDTACNYFDWWNEDMTEYAGHFTTSINDTTHHFTNASGCDSAVTLYLVINRGDTSGHVELACDEFVWNMIHYTANDTITDIHYDENGCVAIDTIYLTVNDRARTTVYDTACDTYTWDFNGQTYTTSQTIIDTVPGSNGCDSIVTLHLTVNYHTNLRVDTTVCDAYTWHNQIYTASTIDTVGYYNNDGCPSRDTLHLTIRHNSNTLYTDTVCDSVRWHGMLLTTTDDHLYNYVSGEDCPSTDTLRLQVNRSVRFVESIFACDSLTWRDDSTYTASSDMVSLFHTTTPEGCDSSIWLSLTVKYSSEIPVPDSAKACDYYNWAVKTGYMGANGFVQTDLKVLNVNTTGVHKTEFCKNAAGCDSLRVLNLSLRYRDTADATAEGCGSYSYYSTQYTSNSQHDTVLTVFHKETRNYANRCDSVTRLHLTLHPVKDQNAPEYTTACDAYTWNGRTYRTSGNYESRDTTMYGCDSIVTLILVVNHADSSQHDSAVVCDQTTWMGKIYRNTGIYRDTITTHEGCDSIRILYLTVHHRTHNRIDTTVCDYIYWPNDVTYDTISTTTYGVVTHLTYPYLYGCEQVDTLYLTVKNSTTIEFDSSVCDSVRWYSPTNRQGEWYKTSGDIRHTFLDKNSQNCDSSLLMHLTVHPTLLQVETLASCDSVMWHGAWLTTSQNVGLTYDSTYSDGRQCRVTDSLYFTRNGNNVYRQNESKFACDTFTWSRNAMTYAESGTYTDTLRNAAGCDSSIATLVLTIAYGNYDTLDTVSCLAPVEWNDSTYAVQGTYVIADTTPQGCPSLQILILHTGYYDTLDATSKCERYTWNGIEYTHEGYSLVADTHTTAFGCDSNTYLPLTIIKSQRTRIDTALFGPEYFWALHNKTYTQPGTYIDTIDYSLSMNCGRIDTLVLQLTNVPLPQILANTSHTIIMLNHYPDGEDGDRVDYEVYRWYMDGVLQNGKTTDVFNNRDWSSLNGHYYYLEVLYNNMWLRSNTVDLRTTGIDEATESIDFAIYPNPVISGRTLTMTLQGDNLDLHGATLTVFDLHGRDLLNTAVSGERTSLSADLPAGVYNLRLTLSDGRTAVKKLIVR